jgi:hypothetical protein
VLDVEEGADAGEHLEPRTGGKVFFGVADQAHVDAAVVFAVQVERGLGRRAAQLGTRVLGPVIGDRRGQVLRLAQAALGIGGVPGQVTAGTPVTPQPVDAREVLGGDEPLHVGRPQEVQVLEALALLHFGEQSIVQRERRYRSATRRRQRSGAVEAAT